MKTIERYVFSSFLSSFILAFLVLSFVLTIGLLVQIVGYVMDGVPMQLVGEFCMVSLPETLQWSMPLALLVSSVLVFSRMSADSEIAAMRACGVNLLSVVRWPALFALACTLLSFWVNNEIVPRGHEIRRNLKLKVSAKTGISLLEPGRVIDDFAGYKFIVGDKNGDWLQDLVVWDFSDEKITRTISAAKAHVVQDGADIRFRFYDMYVYPVSDEIRTRMHAEECPYRLKNVSRQMQYHKRIKDFRYFEMLDEIDRRAEELRDFKGTGDARVDGLLYESRRRELCAHRVELNKRFVFAMASICFVLIGIPLGIRSQRRESSVGMAISLAVSLGYYMLVILMLSLEEQESIYPYVLIWLPVFVCLGLAARLIRKHL